MENVRTDSIGANSAEVRADLKAELEEVKQYWGWVLGLGICLMGLGVVACIAAELTTLTSVVFLGWMLLIAGVVQIAHAFSFRIGKGFIATMLSGVLYAVAGFLLASRPGLGAVSITMMLSAFFLAAGVGRAVYAAVERYRGWGWSLFSGVLTTIMGLFVWGALPEAALWVLGTFVGVEMIFSGWAIAMLAGAARGLAPSKAIFNETQRAA